MLSAKHFNLKNGLKIITCFDDSNPIVCLQLTIKTGSVKENDETSGFSHFIEHLVFKCTKKYPDNSILTVVTRAGGIINAYTEYDSTCFYLMLPAEKLELGLDVLSEMIIHPVWNNHDLNNEKDIIREEIKQYSNEPESAFIDWIQETYFSNSPLKRPVLGTIKSIQQADNKSLLSFYQKNYRPDNAFLVISGSYNETSLKQLLKKYFNQWSVPHFTLPGKKIHRPEKNGFRLFGRIKQNSGDFLAFVLPELCENDLLSNPMLLLLKAFASGNRSRLFKRLVEHDKTAINIKLYSISGVLHGITIIEIVPRTSDLIPDIIYAFYDEFMKLVRNGLSNHEILITKKELLYSWMYDFEYLESIAGSLTEEELIGSYMNLYKFPDQIKMVERKDLASALSKYWNKDYLAIFQQGKNRLSKVVDHNVNKLFAAMNCNNASKSIHSEVKNSIIYHELVKEYKNVRHKQDEFRQVILDNGMNLVMKYVASKPTIGVALTLPLSQLSESCGKQGVNYFTSNLMLFGTQNKTYDAIQKECLENGFNLKVSHTLETTTIRGKCLEFGLKKMLRLVSEIVQTPAFPPSYLNIIKSNVYDSIRRDKTSPFTNAYNKWLKLFLGSATNLNRPVGTITSTKKISQKDIMDWYTAYYRVPNFTLAVTGNIDFDKVQDLCNRYFVNSGMHYGIPEQIPLFSLSERHLSSSHTSSDQANVILGGLSCPASDIESTSALLVLSQVLGGDLSSRFFTILREKYGFAYQTGFDFSSTRSFGFWYAYAICDKADSREVTKLMQEIIEDIRINGISEDELLTAKNYLRGMLRLDMESIGWQANSLSLLYSLGYDYDYFKTKENRIDSVTHAKVTELCNKWFRPEEIYIYQEK